MYQFTKIACQDLPLINGVIDNSQPTNERFHLLLSIAFTSQHRCSSNHLPPRLITSLVHYGTLVPLANVNVANASQPQDTRVKPPGRVPGFEVSFSQWPNIITSFRDALWRKNTFSNTLTRSVCFQSGMRSFLKIILTNLKDQKQNKCFISLCPIAPLLSKNY